MSKLIFLMIAAFSLAEVLTPSEEEVKLHEPDGKCHTDYKDPNDCRHPCDHTFCDCQKACDNTCKVKKEDCGKCRNQCFVKHAECSNKCCEDGKVEC